MNVGKSNVMVLERKEEEVCNFRTPYRVNVPLGGRCAMVLGGETMEKVNEVKYLGTILQAWSDEGRNE